MIYGRLFDSMLQIKSIIAQIVHRNAVQYHKGVKRSLITELIISYSPIAKAATNCITATSLLATFFFRLRSLKRADRYSLFIHTTVSNKQEIIISSFASVV